MSRTLLTLVPSDFAHCSFCNEPIQSGKACIVLLTPVEKLDENGAFALEQQEGFDEGYVHPGDVAVDLDWSEEILVHKRCINKHIHKDIDLLD